MVGKKMAKKFWQKNSSEALSPKRGCFWEANLKNFFEMRG
jgi:hypothetical protein